METSSSPCDCDQRQPDGSCGVLNEFARLRSPGGRAEALRAYLDELRQRGDEQAGGGSARDLAARLHRLGVPAQTVGDLQGPRPTAALESAQRFVKLDASLAPFLLLLGPVGIGKSVAAAWVLEQFAKGYAWNSQPTRAELQPAMWVDGRELTGVREFREEHQTWLKAMQGTALLVLDDAGHEATEAGRNALTDILLARLAKKRRTVLTANLKAEDLRKRYGDALADRFRAQAIIPGLSGASMRSRRTA